MPIGPIVNGTPTTITPDADPAAYASIQGPSPTMDVIAQDILDLSLVVLNVQRYSRRPELDTSKDYLYASQQVQIIQRSPWIAETQIGVSGWYVEDTVATIGGDGPMGPIQSDASTGFAIKKMLDLPHGSVLNVVQFGRLGIGHSATPATPPSFHIRKKRLSDGLVSTVATNVDAYTYPTYDTYQGVSIPNVGSIAETIDNTAFEYWVFVVGEHGVNSVNLGYILVYVDALVTITKVDKRAS